MSSIDVGIELLESYGILLAVGNDILKLLTQLHVFEHFGAWFETVESDEQR